MSALSGSRSSGVAPQKRSWARPPWTWRRRACACVLSLACAVQLPAAVFTVTNIVDDGPGSFRAAIELANALPGPDAITFQIPGSPPFRIQPKTPLPGVADTLSVDGTTQPGYAGSPLVELDGSALASGSGLRLAAPACAARALAIHSFPDSGIELGAPGGNLIVGNRVGSDASGLQALGNGTGLTVLPASSFNTIGGASLSDRNLISGNVGPGVLARGSSNVFQGNWIGLDASGEAALPNQGEGLRVELGSANTVGGSEPGAGNVISGNQGHGLVLSGRGHVIHGNRLGTDPSGHHRLGNGRHGVLLAEGAQDVTVGGATFAERNLISANQRTGVTLLGVATSNNVVQGNWVGCSISGLSALPNREAGLEIAGGAAHNTIGGIGLGDGNVMSGNLGAGLMLGRTGAVRNVIQGNRVGLAPDGRSALPNQGPGLALHEGAVDNLVGGFEQGAGNRIACNRRDGIWIRPGPDSRGNLVTGNTVWDNGGLGINVQPTGEPDHSATPNDPLDADAGMGEVQNHPLLTNVVAVGERLLLSGRLESLPGRDYQIDLYASRRVDPSGFGEGEQVVSAFFITTQSNGLAEFNLLLEGDWTGRFFSATATEALAGTTSEFSPFLAMPGVFQFTSLVWQGLDVAITFTTEQHRRYQLEFAEPFGPVLEWRVVTEGSDVAGVGGLVTVVQAGGATRPAALYRARQLP